MNISIWIKSEYVTYIGIALHKRRAGRLLCILLSLFCIYSLSYSQIEFKHYFPSVVTDNPGVTAYALRKQ